MYGVFMYKISVVDPDLFGQVGFVFGSELLDLKICITFGKFFFQVGPICMEFHAISFTVKKIMNTD
jgi:hypothetical protein